MKTHDFNLEKKDHVKLCDLLGLLQLCESAGVAKHFIADGLVKVDGVIELQKRKKIIAGQTVEFDGQRINILAAP
jgi:ribosome-associated protein